MEVEGGLQRFSVTTPVVTGGDSGILKGGGVQRQFSSKRLGGGGGGGSPTREKSIDKIFSKSEGGGGQTPVDLPLCYTNL